MLIDFFMISRAEFDKKISDILMRPEYAHLKNGVRDFLESLRERINDWIRDFLNNAFSGISPVPELSGQTSVLFVIAGLLIIAAIIVFIAVKAGRAFERSPKVREILGERISEGTTTAGLRSKAGEYRKGGDFRMAVRYEYIALLLLMHEKGLLYLEETKTNAEILLSLKKTEFSMLSAFQSLADMFNASWYGHKTMEESYGKWSDSMNLIWSRVAANEEKI